MEMPLQVETDAFKTWHSTERMLIANLEDDGDDGDDCDDGDSGHRSARKFCGSISHREDSVDDKYLGGPKPIDSDHSEKNVLSARVVKDIVPMDELEFMEASIREVLSSTREILDSVFLLDDTPDGLFSSVPISELPNNLQLQKIAVPPGLSFECKCIA